MRFLFFITSLFLVGNVAFAQRGELNSAKNNYAKFQLLQSNNEDDGQLTLLNMARKSADNAIIHDKTKNSAELWAFRSLIYAALSMVDSTSRKDSVNYFQEANNSVKKAEELNQSGEFKELVYTAKRNLAIITQNKGVECYQKEDYPCAYQAFDFVASTLPNDTTFHYYAGLAAKNAKMNKEALSHFQQAVDNGMKNPSLFAECYRTSLEQKDTVTAIAVIAKGRSLNPDNMPLIYEEINLYIARGRVSEIITKLIDATKKDPNNKLLFFILGNAYEKAGKVDDAEKAYLSAISLNPTYFDALYNLGALYVNRANAVLTKANKLPTTKQGQTEYNKQKAILTQLFITAADFLEKASEVSPNDTNTLRSLHEIYLTTNNTEKASIIQKKLDDIK